MATKTVQINDTSYTKLDTGVETAIDIQNVSSGPIRVIFSASQPSAESNAYYYLRPEQGVSRDGKTGDMWGLSLLQPTANVTVGE